jgi:hypothetical protein
VNPGTLPLELQTQRGFCFASWGGVCVDITFVTQILLDVKSVLQIFFAQSENCTMNYFTVCNILLGATRKCEIGVKFSIS